MTTHIDRNIICFYFDVFLKNIMQKLKKNFSVKYFFRMLEYFDEGIWKVFQNLFIE